MSDTYIHTYIHTHTHTYIHTHKHTHTYTHTHTRLGDLWLVGGASNVGCAVLRQQAFSSSEIEALSKNIDPMAIPKDGIRYTCVCMYIYIYIYGMFFCLFCPHFDGFVQNVHGSWGKVVDMCACMSVPVYTLMTSHARVSKRVYMCMHTYAFLHIVIAQSCVRTFNSNKCIHSYHVYTYVLHSRACARIANVQTFIYTCKPNKRMHSYYVFTFTLLV